MALNPRTEPPGLSPPLNQGRDDIWGKLRRRAGCQTLADGLIDIGRWWCADDHDVGYVHIPEAVGREVTVGREEDILSLGVGS
jgi:hypothetical protein